MRGLKLTCHGPIPGPRATSVWCEPSAAHPDCPGAVCPCPCGWHCQHLANAPCPWSQHQLPATADLASSGLTRTDPPATAFPATEPTTTSPPTPELPTTDPTTTWPPTPELPTPVPSTPELPTTVPATPELPTTELSATGPPIPELPTTELLSGALSATNSYTQRQPPACTRGARPPPDRLCSTRLHSSQVLECRTCPRHKSPGQHPPRGEGG